MDFSAVGKKIRELRKQVGMSQGELANRICKQAQISKIEKGDVSVCIDIVFDFGAA